MSTVFRGRIEPTEQSDTTVPGPVQPVAKPVDTFHSQENPETVEVYEFEKGHRIADSYFGLREVAAGDWNVKMSLARIDKFVKSQMDSKQYDKTVLNYRGFLQEMEGKIGSSKLNGKARIDRILNYITLMQKTQHMENLKKKFFGFDN